MAAVSVRVAWALLGLVVLLDLPGSAPAQLQAPINPNAEKQPQGAYGLSAPTVPQPAVPTTAGPPLYGAARPNVGPDPTPRIRRPTDCPLGYETPRDRFYVAHLVVCVVKPLDLVALHSPTGPSPAPVGQPLSSLPPILERSQVNQCSGRPAGSYACGRGASECCGPHQDNMCFAGSFACYAAGTGTGPKTACCISK
jgi:hypothetical protein